jgi:hypothetical protein
MKKTLTVTFEVDDDLTSERAADYRASMVEAMSKHQENYLEAVRMIGPEQVDCDAAFNAVLIDKLLNDCNR